MSDLTRYRRVCGFGHDDDCHSVYKEDDTLQQIVDALPEIIRGLELAENGGDVLDYVARLRTLDGLVNE